MTMGTTRTSIPLTGIVEVSDSSPDDFEILKPLTPKAETSNVSVFEEGLRKPLLDAE